MTSKEILDKWATAIVPKEAIWTNKEGQPQVNQDKVAHYGERGYKGDEVLWIAPKDCIRIEFEDKPDRNHRFILELESAAKSKGYDYCITGHKGKSDYFNMFNIQGIPLNDDNQVAKMLLIDELMPSVAKDQLDRTNLGWTLSPIIEHPHWKPKYNGEIHKLIRGTNPLEHKNKYPSRFITQIKKAKEWHKQNYKKWKKATWVEDFLLNFCCTHHLPEGSRHLIIEKNLAAFIFDRKDKEDIKSNYYKVQGRTHDSLRTWERAILNGNYVNASAGELAKFIKEHKLEYDLPPLEEEKEEGKEAATKLNAKELEENTKRRSTFITDKIIAEQVYDGEENKFCVYDIEKDSIYYLYSLQDEEFTIKPIIDEEVEKKAILLPSKAEEYNSDDNLDEEIKSFINKWLDVPEDFMQFAIWNVKRSWVYDRFHTLNYLRALGDTGMGKSRFLDTLGYIHYKPIATSGATTAAPIFRIINKWKGTLIIDEADFKQSDESHDIIKIINQGYEKGRQIMRCDQNNADKVQFFDPYCPKIIATRKPFDDKATESRCITTVMMGTNRKDIPVNLTNGFFKDAEHIRNMLLMWRFKHYNIIDPDKEIKIEGFDELEPRLRQVVNGLINLFATNEKQMQKFKDYILEKQEDLIDERKGSFAGQIVGAIHEMLQNSHLEISSQDIIEKAGLKEYNGNEPLKPRSLSKYLKELGFGKTIVKKVNNEPKRCIPLEKGHLTTLFKRYGFDENVVTMVTVVTQVTIDTEAPTFENEIHSEVRTDLSSKNESPRNDRNLRNCVTNNNNINDIKPQHIVVETLQPQHIDIKQQILGILENQTINIQDFVEQMKILEQDPKKVEFIIKEGTKKGDWFEFKPNHIKKL